MTIVKTAGVRTSRHARNLRAYLEDKDALARETVNIIEEGRAFEEMAETRRLAGHDRPSRKGAENTIMLHFVLAFLPEEADVNGGPMTPEACMAYAREFMARRGYDEHQVVLALHREHCEADGTDRYAVHIAVNRTNLRTGKRLHEGRSAQAKRDRAATVRELDAEWGLHQVAEGVPNSAIHALQPDRQGAERRIVERAAGRGVDAEDASCKHDLRELCRLLKQHAASMEEYRDLLAGYGVETEVKGGRVYATDADNREYAFSLARLDRALASNALEAAFARNAGDRRMAALEAELREKRRQIDEYAAIKRDYLSVVEGSYRDYRELARSLEGTRFDAFPRIKMPRVPEALARDAEVKRKALSYVYKGDELRLKLASNVPRASRGRPSGTVGSPGQSAPNVSREEPQRGNRGGRGER
ncbi:relaxase/mobilization nuclease domain-containing protein [Arabiibacter massiliensis]|uniref:relaxase/mobilization nuclease domain-containing protein n=1 Tax=Arabiibacter massiliensis TaxID=1870985 RepID=UPI00155ABFE4|nr:relaxase/mobilization nuclease domain-containing protein [Arabiibacter massiliensis]